MQQIIWNKVTNLSQIVAIVLFVAVFGLGFYIGGKSKKVEILGAPIAVIRYSCEDSKTIDAEFYKNSSHIKLSDDRQMYLPQTISASGIRYANSDESLIFWSKGQTAFIQEGNINTFQSCQAVL